MRIKNTIKKSVALLLVSAVLITAASCATKTSDLQTTAPPTEETAVINSDREGNIITLPDNIKRVVSLGPSNTEILSALGLGDLIVGIDSYSSNVGGIGKDLPMFSMMAINAEQLLVLEPDVIFVTGMSKFGGDDPLKIVSDAGICVIYIPSSDSVTGVMEDIRFIAEVMGVTAAGEVILTDMRNEIDRVKSIGETITEKKTVYFEYSAAPEMYTFGEGVYMNELIEFLGGVNIFNDFHGWMPISDEAVLDANPDVILTSVNYLDDPIGEIMSRPGWDNITAVQNGDVYYIDNDASNRPSQNIIKALLEMAKAVYPEKY